VTPPELADDLLSAYLDDELDADTRAAVEARLATSSEWRALLGEVREARDAVRALPRLTLPPEVWDRMLEAVAADAPAEPADTPAAPGGVVVGLRRGVKSRPARWAGVAALATAAAVLAAVVLPAQARITPKVATFSNEQSARASVGGDPVSALAGVGLMRGLGR
jgi:anti-sigma factor RsiW